MLLQTNSYIVPQDKRAEHARLLRRFRQVLARLGCDQFEVYEQVGSNWNTAEITGRVVQIMRFRDRRHQLAVQAAERNDPVAQAVIAEFCNLINFPYQQQQGLFAVGFYNAVLPASPARGHAEQDAHVAADAKAAAAVGAGEAAAAGTGVAPEAAPSADEAAPPVAEPPSDREGAPVEAASAALALDAEEPLFAEGTEGIIEAAEHLSDEQLDAGGDAAVASSIAGPGNVPSNNGPPQEHAEEPERLEPSQAARSQATPPQADSSQAQQPQDSNGHVAEQTSSGGVGDDLDLSSLLDPHIDPDNGHVESYAHGGARGEWTEDLSLEGVLDEESINEDSLPVKDAALEGESEHDRDHVAP
jgi:hypothetical protein